MEATTTAAGGERPRRGHELELQIDSLAQGGRGIARTETGFVIFVAGGLPGDRWQVGADGGALRLRLESGDTSS